MNAIITAPKRECRQYTQDEREAIVENVLFALANAQSLMSVTQVFGVDDSTVLGWIQAEPSWEAEYERLKVIRSRVLVEQAIDALGTLGNEGVSPKCVDIAIRHRMRLAALLNPKEFSERMLANPRAPLGNGRVSFNLTFAGEQPKQGSMTIEYAPGEGE